MEQEEYTREEIDWSYIEFIDNQDVLDLIEKVCESSCCQTFHFRCVYSILDVSIRLQIDAKLSDLIDIHWAVITAIRESMLEPVNLKNQNH